MLNKRRAFFAKAMLRESQIDSVSDETRINNKICFIKKKKTSLYLCFKIGIRNKLQ